MKYATEKSLVAACTIWSALGQYLSIALLGIGLGARSQAQIRAYVANEGGSFSASSTVSVIDIATNTVVATIPVGPIPFAPIGVATAPDGTRAYVTNAGVPFDSANGTVAVIDTATNTVVATIPVGILPEAVAITPDGTRAYVANTASSTVSVVDTSTNTVVVAIAGLLDPLGVAITPDGTRAYVANAANFSVSVIDTATNTVVATIPDVSGFGVAITPDGTRAYVANGTVTVIDTATNTVGVTIPVGGFPTVGVAITPDGTRAYVTNAGNGVSVIDAATNTVVTTIPITAAGPPIAIAITTAPRVPKSKKECKRGGYLKFGPPAGPFKNQGQCVSYVEHH